MPITAPPGLTANESLEIRTFIRLFKVTLTSVNQVLRYAVTDVDLPPVDVADGTGLQTYIGAYPGVNYEGAEKRIDLQIDKMTVTIPNYPLTLGNLGTNLLARWATLDVFDGAIVDHYVWDIDSNSVMKYARWFVQAALKWSYESVTFSLESLASRFDRNCPRTLVQESCNNKLYDKYCTLNQPDFTAHGTVDPSITPTRQQFALAVSSQGSHVPGTMTQNYFALGIVQFTGGALAPVRRMCLQSSSGQNGVPPFLITLATPLPFAPTVGETVDCSAGCDKTAAMCTAVFGNLANYRGMPYTPSSEVIWTVA